MASKLARNTQYVSSVVKAVLGTFDAVYEFPVDDAWTDRVEQIHDED